MGGAASAPAMEDAQPNTEILVKDCVKRHTMVMKLNIGKEDKFPRDELKQLYPEASDELFNAVLKLFDWTLKGQESLHNVKMFSMLMVALLYPKGEDGGRDHHFEIAFHIFDVTNTGDLDRSEFRSMWRAMYATRISALKLVYSTKAGHDMLKAYAEKEHSSENIDFVDAVVHWQSSADHSTDEAGAVIHKYIGASTDCQVNIGTRTQRKLEADFKAAVNNGAPLNPDVFDKAKGDILKVIEKDTFARFNKDQERMEELFAKEFDEADADHTGRISMQNYIQWATKTPEVIQFYESLTAIKHKHRPKDDAPAE